jgi:hypothetical protein
MNNIPGINLLPEKWQPVAAFAVIWLIPQLGRVYHALASGGGIKGIWSAVMFGTNTPKPPLGEATTAQIAQWTKPPPTTPVDPHRISS